jgi:ribosomal protein S8E
MLTGQGQITEFEQKLLIKARSGDINFTKGEIKTILNVAERAANSQYVQSNKLLKSAATKSETAQMFLDNVQKLPTAPTANSITIGNKTYTRPPAFTDEQWTAYKKSQGG